LSEVEIRTVPNQGIHRSARNALSVGLVFGLGGWLVFGLVFGLGGGLVVGLVFGLGSGLFVGLFVGLGGGLVVALDAGGEACLKHFLVRFWLARDGSAPWNYVTFLDHAAERILLRKVGGGYAFIHRMLLEYFAARYVAPSIGDGRPAKLS
jgi:hypothetical protein